MMIIRQTGLRAYFERERVFSYAIAPFYPLAKKHLDRKLLPENGLNLEAIAEKLKIPDALQRQKMLGIYQNFARLNPREFLYQRDYDEMIADLLDKKHKPDIIHPELIFIAYDPNPENKLGLSQRQIEDLIQKKLEEQDLHKRVAIAPYANLPDFRAKDTAAIPLYLRHLVLSAPGSRERRKLLNQQVALIQKIAEVSSYGLTRQEALEIAAINFQLKRVISEMN